MNRHRLTICVIALAAVAGAAPAHAKDGVVAQLTSPAPVAVESDRARLSWTLSFADDGVRHPFTALGVFVRLRGASGDVVEALAVEKPVGSYRAEVAVPDGGIVDMEVGLHGWSSLCPGGGCAEADAMFPIANDPFPGTPRARAASTPTEDGAVSPTWVAIAIAGGVAVAGWLSVVWRRRRMRLPIVETLDRHRSR